MKRHLMSSNDPTSDPSFPTRKGPKELREEVLDAGLCTVCGMCLGLCPYIEEMGENVAFISDCRGDQGRCYAVCPRTATDLDDLRRLVMPDRQTDFVLGPHASIWMARAKDEAVRAGSQYGGTVTALALFAIETGRADAALLTAWSQDPDEPHASAPLVARTRAEVLSASGSKYTASPTLKVLDSLLKEDAEKVFVVGRPCQVLALRKRMQIEDPTFPAGRIRLVVGLFCMWSLSYREFEKMIEPVVGDEKLKRIDVPQGRFLVETDRETLDLDHDTVRSHSRQTCQSCFDFTSELADLSVGSTEWKDDWNTLIVRTEAGRAFLDAAVEQGWLEVEPFPEVRLRLLKEASFNKKKRVLEQIEEEAAKNGVESYLKISQEEKDFLLRAQGPGTEE
jgi:coenzyme F420-reducing hydrogenase beta subunit